MKKMAILNAAQALRWEQGASVLSAENTTRAGGCGRRCALWAEQIFRKYGVPGDYGLEPADLVFLNSVLTAFPVRIREKSGFSLICQLFFANYNQDIRVFRYRLPDWVGEKMPIRPLTGSAGIAAGFDGGRLWAREGVAGQLRGLGSGQEWFWGWKSEDGQLRELGSWERPHGKAVEVRRSSPWGRELVGISGKSGENETPAVRSGLAVFRGIDHTALGAGMTGAVARGTGAQAERGRQDRGYTGIPTQEYRWELLRLTAAGFKAAFRTVPAGRKSILLVCGAQRRKWNRTVKGLPARIVTAETGLAQSQRLEAGWPPAGLVEAELAEAVPTETEAAGIKLAEMGAAKEGSAGNRPVEAVTAELRTAAFFEETKASGSLADSIRVGPRIGTGLEFLQAIPCTGDQDRLECFRQKKAGRLAGVEMHGKPAGPPLPGITVWTKRMASYEEFGCSGPAAVAAEPNLARRAVKDGTAAFFAPSVKLVLSHGAVRLMLYGPSARGFWTGFMARSAVGLQLPGSPVWEQRPGRPADLTRLTLTSGKGWPAVVAWALRSGLSANSELSGPATGLPSGLSAGTGSFGQSENEVSRVTFADTKLSGPAMWTGRGGQIADNLPGSLFADKVFRRIPVWPDGSGRSAGIMPFRIFVGKVYGNTSVWPEVPGLPAGIIQFRPIGYIVSHRIRIWPDGSGWSADIMPGNSFVDKVVRSTATWMAGSEQYAGITPHSPFVDKVLRRVRAWLAGPDQSERMVTVSSYEGGEFSGIPSRAQLPGLSAGMILSDHFAGMKLPKLPAYPAYSEQPVNGLRCEGVEDFVVSGLRIWTEQSVDHISRSPDADKKPLGLQLWEGAAGQSVNEFWDNLFVKMFGLGLLTWPGRQGIAGNRFRRLSPFIMPPSVLQDWKQKRARTVELMLYSSLGRMIRPAALIRADRTARFTDRFLLKRMADSGLCYSPSGQPLSTVLPATQLRLLQLGQLPAGQKAADQQRSGQLLSGQQRSGQPLSGQSPLGKQPAGQPLSSQQPAGQPLSGQPLSDQPPLGQQRSGQPLSSQQPAGQPLSGQTRSDQPPLGQQRSGQPLSSQQPASQPLSGQPLDQQRSGQPLSGQLPLDQLLSGRQLVRQPPLDQLLSGQQQVCQLPLGQLLPGQLPPGQPPPSMSQNPASPGFQLPFEFITGNSWDFCFSDYHMSLQLRHFYRRVVRAPLSIDMRSGQPSGSILLKPLAERFNPVIIAGLPPVVMSARPARCCSRIPGDPIYSGSPYSETGIAPEVHLRFTKPFDSERGDQPVPERGKTSVPEQRYASVSEQREPSDLMQRKLSAFMQRKPSALMQRKPFALMQRELSILTQRKPSTPPESPPHISQRSNLRPPFRNPAVPAHHSISGPANYFLRNAGKDAVPRPAKQMAISRILRVSPHFQTSAKRWEIKSFMRKAGLAASTPESLFAPLLEQPHPTRHIHPAGQPHPTAQPHPAQPLRHPAEQFLPPPSPPNHARLANLVFLRPPGTELGRGEAATQVPAAVCDFGDPFARYNAYNETHGQSGSAQGAGERMKRRERQLEQEYREVQILREKLTQQEKIVERLEKGQTVIEDHVRQMTGGGKISRDVIRQLRREVAMEKKRFGIE